MATRSASTSANARRPEPLFTVLLGDAELETILFADLVTMAATSPSRSSTGKLRRAIEVRDRRCQHPSGATCRPPAATSTTSCPTSTAGRPQRGTAGSSVDRTNQDPLKHDHGAAPFPPRQVTVLDEIRARLRGQLRHEHPDEHPDTDSLPMATAGVVTPC